MLRDITIGQYFPGESIIHRLDPRFKIVLTILFIVMVFTGDKFICLSVGAVFTVLVILLSGIKIKMFLKTLKSLLPLMLLTVLLNLFFIKSGDVLWQWKFLKITSEGVDISIFMIVRISLLLMGTSVLTYTTSPITLTAEKAQISRTRAGNDDVDRTEIHSDSHRGNR